MPAERKKKKNLPFLQRTCSVMLSIISINFTTWWFYLILNFGPSSPLKLATSLNFSVNSHLKAKLTPVIFKFLTDVFWWLRHLAHSEEIATFRHTNLAKKGQ